MAATPPGDDGGLEEVPIAELEESPRAPDAVMAPARVAQERPASPYPGGAYPGGAKGPAGGLAGSHPEPAKPVGPVAQLFAGSGFEKFSAFVTVLNAVVLGLAAENAITEALQRAGDASDSSSSVSTVFTYFSYGFTAFYTAEILLKVMAFGHVAFAAWDSRSDLNPGLSDRRWNCFDLLLVIVAIAELVNANLNSDEDNTSIVLVLRLLKLFKLLRLVQIMRFFTELRVMMLCIAGSVRMLFWTIAMLSVIMYMFGLCFMQGATTLVSGPGGADELIVLAVDRHWGSLSKSVISLFEAITNGNDWALMAEPLKEAGLFYYAMFLFYMAFLSIAVLNVLTGMYVQAAMDISTSIECHDRSDEMRRQRMAVNDLGTIISTAGADEAGEITWEDFTAHLHDKALADYFAHLDVDVDEAELFFKTVASAGSKVIAQDFINGCAQVRGQAKGIDVAAVRYEQRQLAAQLDAIAACLADEFAARHSDGGGEQGGNAGHSSVPVTSPSLADNAWASAVLSCEDLGLLQVAGERISDRIRHVSNGEVPAPSFTFPPSSGAMAHDNGYNIHGSASSYGDPHELNAGDLHELQAMLAQLPGRVAAEAAAETRRATIEARANLAEELAPHIARELAPRLSRAAGLRGQPPSVAEAAALALSAPLAGSGISPSLPGPVNNPHRRTPMGSGTASPAQQQSLADRPMPCANLEANRGVRSSSQQAQKAPTPDSPSFTEMAPSSAEREYSWERREEERHAYAISSPPPPLSHPPGTGYRLNHERAPYDGRGGQRSGGSSERDRDSPGPSKRNLSDIAAGRGGEEIMPRTGNVAGSSVSGSSDNSGGKSKSRHMRERDEQWCQRSCA